MNKNTLIAVLIAILAFGAIAYFAWTGGSTTNTNAGPEPALSAPILFVGTGCPHCKIVEDFIKQYAVDTKMTFETREVFFNSANADIMKKRAATCGMATDQLGVPLFWDGSKCYDGDVDIVNYFRDRLGIPETNATGTAPTATTTKK